MKSEGDSNSRPSQEQKGNDSTREAVAVVARSSTRPALVTPPSSPAPLLSSAPVSCSLRLLPTPPHTATYGHVAALAKAIAEGVNATQGVRAKLFRVRETLPKDVLAKMHAPPTPADDDPAHPPVLSDPKDLAQADGIIFGGPTRFGGFPTQLRAVFDATGGLWQSGALAGKPAGLFCSVGTQGGGSETTLLTVLPYLAHQGMMFVPIGYTAGSAMFGMEQVRGGNPYGATTFAGSDGSRQPTQEELMIAAHQGSYFAGVVKRLG